jgi:glycosyltransferase involved in cell wall biosynthesis
MIVTVVTPTLNAIAHLRECIESVRRNEAPGVEVEHVIVDGGSTDGTTELAESYSLQVMKGKDKGIFDAINKGSFNSSGELLGFLGADDVMLDGGLAAIVHAYQQGGKRWVVGGIRWIDERGNSLGGLAAPPTWLVPRIHVCLDWNPIMHMATYFSRQFYIELGGFNPEFKDAGDFEMFARALSKAPYERVSREIACFRRTGANNSVVQWERSARESGQVFRTFGPSSNLERQWWRYLLKAWFNFRNPEWFVRKVLESVHSGLGLQEKRYF